MAFQFRSRRVVDPGERRVGGRTYPAWRLRTSVLRVLRENVLCSMATVSRVNRAHINTAYFSYSDDLELFFLSDRSSSHCRNLVPNPSMAVPSSARSRCGGHPTVDCNVSGPAARHEAANERRRRDRTGADSRNTPDG